MMAFILWAHRRFSSRVQTHNAPFSAVPCVGGDRREQPTINAPRPSPFARLRRTRPTLTKDHQPNRLPPQRLSFAPCLFAAPKGVHAARRWAVSAAALCARQLQPNSLPSFAPPSSTLNKMRPAHSNARQKTATLRRSCSFGYGQQGTQRNGRAATAVYIFSGMPLPPCLAPQCALLPVPKALRPPLHLS